MPKQSSVSKPVRETAGFFFRGSVLSFAPCLAKARIQKATCFQEQC